MNRLPQAEGTINTSSSGGVQQRKRWSGREIGLLGALARIGLGAWFAGSVVYGELLAPRHYFHPGAWALGLIVFPVVVLAWHWLWIRRNPAPFRYTSPLSFAISLAIPLALYFTWWYAPALSITSDAALLFYGASMILAGFRGYAGCEILALSSWLLRRNDQIACAVFMPFDVLDQRLFRVA